MATPENRADIRQRIRRKLMAFPEDVTTLNGALNSSTASVVLASGTYTLARMLLEIDNEIMRVRSISSNTATVLRGDQGTTAASHSNGATVQVWPFWGWSDAEVNDAINCAIDWLYPEVWYPKHKQNTLESDAKEFGLPDGVRYPDGEHIIGVEVEDDDGQFRPFHSWRHANDRLIFDRKIDVARDIRLLLLGKHARLTSDAQRLYSSEPVDAIVEYATGRLLENLLANRTRYVEYSASLNDRASTPDELQRQIYYFYNQAVLAKDKASRVRPATFASVRRQG